MHSCGWVMAGELVQEVEEQRLLALVLLLVTIAVTMALCMLVKFHPDINGVLKRNQTNIQLQTTFNEVDREPMLKGLDYTQ